MKRFTSLLIVLFLLAGCSNSSVFDNQNTTEGIGIDTPDTDPACYLIQENAENIISIPIPRTTNMSAEEITFVQILVQEKILAMIGEELDLIQSKESVKSKDQVYSQYRILMKSQITYEDDTHVSIIFNGLLENKSSAHPTHWLFSLNYNPQTLQTIPFSQKHTVDKQLYLVFADLAEKAIEEECAGILPTGWESFKEPICSEKAFLDGMLAEDEFCYYMQDTGIVISYPVPFALGNHKEVIIPYDKLEE